MPSASHPHHQRRRPRRTIIGRGRRRLIQATSRRGWAGTWQGILVRWLLAIVVVGSGLGLLGNGPSATVRAQTNLLPPVRALANENAAPREATANDNAVEDNAVAQDGASANDNVLVQRPVTADLRPGAFPGVMDLDDDDPADPLPDVPIFSPRVPPVRADEVAGSPPADQDDDPPYVSNCSPEQAEASFRGDDRLVMTYYYYWYDKSSLDDPALTLRPPADPPIDWHDVAWHERQLTDMAHAGIDVALAVYWGTGPSWSMRGLDKMVEARERLLAAGLRPPAIGLFFDTNSYATILPERPEASDLTTDDGMATLADQVGGFFRHVPACHRARIDGRPLAFFWRADTEDGDRFVFDEHVLTGLNDAVAARHHERLHFVLEQSWRASAREYGVDLGATDFYRWGAALNGPRFLGRTVAVGPGYDDRRIEGRPGYLRDRDSGGTYSRDLRTAVMSGAPWLLLETWNELWEGTAIAETQENGREYLEITARYAALFHRLAKERARDGWTDLGSSESVYLRRLADAPIEQGMPVVEDGRAGAHPFEEDDGTGFFHFAVDRRLGIGADQPAVVEVEYFDAGGGTFNLEYDSLDASAPEDGAYKPTAPVLVADSRTWRIARFALTDAGFRGRQYDGVGDFRLHDLPGEDGHLHTFGRVRVTADPGARPVAFGPESLSFVDPSARLSLGLTWSGVDAANGYVVEVAPFDGRARTAHGFTATDRRRCLGEAAFAPDDAVQAITDGISCRIALEAAPPDGLYRWRVRAVDGQGQDVGTPSDWAFFAVAGH
jgi:hypothetical protein